MPKHKKYDDDVIMPRRHFSRKSKKSSRREPESSTEESGFEDMISSIPQTNEEKNIETAQWTWESKIWITVSCAIVIVLICLVIWFMWGPSRKQEPQKPAHPPPQRPANQKSKKSTAQAEMMEKIAKHKALHEKMKSRKKKAAKKNISPVPGIKPDNPEVLSDKKPEDNDDVIDAEINPSDNKIK